MNWYWLGRFQVTKHVPAKGCYLKIVGLPDMWVETPHVKDQGEFPVLIR